MNTLGTQLYILRKKKRMSMQELAYELGVSKTAVGKWEAGTSKPSAVSLIKICNFYHLNIQQLSKEVKDLPELLY